MVVATQKRNAEGGAGPTVEAPDSAQGSAMRAQLRGMDYASGQAALSPGVQMNEDQSGSKKQQPTPTETVEGTLWAQNPQGQDLPPTIEDVRQGSAGDCYFFAAMVAVAHARPDVIENMITDNGGGSYTVTFGIREGLWAWAGGGEQVTETVTLVYQQGEERGYVARTGALWPLVLERAWAQHNGGIENIEGGQAGEGGEVLMGSGLERVVMDSTTEAQIVTKAAQALTDRAPLTLFGGQGDGTTRQQEIARTVPGLLLGHAYAILEVNRAAKQLKLRNPWGRNHPNGTGWIDASIAKEFFREMHINR